MGSETQSGQILTELLLVVSVVFAIFYMMFQLSQAAIAGQSSERFSATQPRRSR